MSELMRMTKIKFGAKLTRELHDSGINQKMLSIETGISEATISGYCNGSRMPSSENLVSICTALNVSADELLSIRHKVVRKREENDA